MNSTPNTPTRSTDNAHEGQTPADTQSHWESYKLPVCPYNRKQALADALQQEVPPAYLEAMLTEWDMLLSSRLFLTKKVVESYHIRVCPTSNDERGRLWRILCVLDSLLSGTTGPRVPFQVSFELGKRTSAVWLQAVWSTADIDDPSFAITVMMPEEH